MPVHDTDQPMTAAEFAEQRYDLPEAGRWTELVAGRIVQHDPPDEIHGSAVLNLSKAMAEHVQRVDSPTGCPAFDVGLVVEREPDTVRFPAMSYFARLHRFTMLNDTLSELPPNLVADVASTPSRRRDVQGRVDKYLEWGVEHVWVFDTREKTATVATRRDGPRVLGADDVLEAGDLLEGFRLSVAELFAEPSWWR